MTWETWEDRRARERAERQEADLAKSVWLVWATSHPGLHCVCTADCAQSAEVWGKLALDYPSGGVSSMEVAGTVGGLIAASVQEGPLKVGDGVRLGEGTTGTVVSVAPEDNWAGVEDTRTKARCWINLEIRSDDDE